MELRLCSRLLVAPPFVLYQTRNAEDVLAFLCSTLMGYRVITQGLIWYPAQVKAVMQGQKDDNGFSDLVRNQTNSIWDRMRKLVASRPPLT